MKINNSIKLNPLRKSLVDPNGEYKTFKYGFITRSQSRLKPQILIPSDYSWSNGTMSNITVTGTSIGLTTNGTQGSFISTQLIQSDIADNLKRDVDYVKLIFNHTLNGGTVKYFVSNDGGNSFPIEILTSDAIYKLPLPSDSLDNFQSSFNDLRFKILIDGATSPVINGLKINYSLI